MLQVYYIISIVGLLLILEIYGFWPPIIYFLFILIPFFLIELHDILSVKRFILRNYPVVSHLRYMLEFIHLEIQQYFIESDRDGTLFQRNTLFSVSKSQRRTRNHCFWKNDLTSVGYQFSYHSCPKQVNTENTKVTIGGPDCKKPYSASRLNISGMSFGALSPNAIRALNKGANIGNFAHNTGEGGISPYHLEDGVISSGRSEQDILTAELKSLHCNTDACPTGVATQNKRRWSSLNLKDKSVRVANFQRRTVYGRIQVLRNFRQLPIQLQ